MKKITDDKAYSVIPTSDGFVYAYLIERIENSFKVGYKMLSFETGKLARVPKSIYLLSKFGAGYERFIGKIKNYLTCYCAVLENAQTFVVERDGSALLFSAEGEVLWEGSFLYQNTPPGGIAVCGNALWVSFPESGVLIRYNLRTLRIELRIGGEQAPFRGAQGLFASGTKIFIPTGYLITKLDTITYATEEYFNLDEPIYDYKFIDKYEIAVLDSGIYLL